MASIELKAVLTKVCHSRALYYHQFGNHLQPTAKFLWQRNIKLFTRLSFHSGQLICHRPEKSMYALEKRRKARAYVTQAESNSCIALFLMPSVKTVEQQIFNATMAMTILCDFLKSEKWICTHRTVRLNFRKQPIFTFARHFKRFTYLPELLKPYVT